MNSDLKAFVILVICALCFSGMLTFMISVSNDKQREIEELKRTCQTK